MTRSAIPPRDAPPHWPAAVHSRRANRRAGWAGFAHRYGWRAYALPILAVVTVAVLVRNTETPAKPDAGGTIGAALGHSVPATTAADPAGGSAGRAHDGRLQVEGPAADGDQFQAGSTPAPVVINVKSDASTSCATNTYSQLILVSISKQHLWACEGGKQVDETSVTTGKVTDHDQTPLGSWRVQAKQRDRYLVGPGYKDYVHYWVPFNGDFGLHDASWQTMSFGSQDWPTQGSHGCVHTPTATMAWIYRWARVGSTVVTVES